MGGSPLLSSMVMLTSALSVDLQYYELCQNTSCPVNYCYNQGHCYISQTLGCQPTCTCPPAFTDARCFLAGNNFTPTLKSGITRCSHHPCCHSSHVGEDGLLWVTRAKFLKPTEENSKFHLGDDMLCGPWEQGRWGAVPA